MRMLLVGCTAVLSSILLFCTGFILAGLEAAGKAATGSGYELSLLDVGMGWLIGALLFFAIGVILIYMNRKDEYMMTIEEQSSR